MTRMRARFSASDSLDLWTLICSAAGKLQANRAVCYVLRYEGDRTATRQCIGQRAKHYRRIDLLLIAMPVAVLLQLGLDRHRQMHAGRAQPRQPIFAAALSASGFSRVQERLQLASGNVLVEVRVVLCFARGLALCGEGLSLRLIGRGLKDAP